MMQILCTINMRGGSKSIPNKNMKLLNGKPLMAYTIEQARQSGLFEHIVVSTDSEAIAEMARSLGAESWFLRPAELATDTAGKVPAIRHAMLEAEKHFGITVDVLVDLDVTSPLRKVTDIQKAFEYFIHEDANILITTTPARKSPYFNMVEVRNGRVVLVKSLANSILRRQDSPQVFDINASIYIWKRDHLLRHNSLFDKKTVHYIMPEERSIDIDTELDFEFVSFLLANKDREKTV
jgi:CMP-N,N'-diacetyllegionaminic acid synthase